MLQRVCSKCGEVINYSNQGNFNRAERLGSLCKVCAGLARFTSSLVGKVGDLVVLKQIIPSHKPHCSSWLVRCVCGVEWVVSGASLRSGGTKRCWTCKSIEGGKKRRRFNDEEKWCPKCEKWLPLNDFGINACRPSGRTDRCRGCSRDGYYENEYDLSPDQRASMSKKQGGGCAICGSHSRLCVDHNHETGKIRGLLCTPCNVMLGRFNDDPEKLERAIQYLKAEFALLIVGA